MIQKKIFGWLSGIALAAMLAACSSGDGGTTPAVPAGPQPIVLDGVLSGDQEVPVVTTGGSGALTITVSGDGSRMDYDIDIDGPLSSNITMAHIHIADAGFNGPVVFWLCDNTGTAPSGIPVPQACAQPPPTVVLGGSLTSADLDPNSGVAGFADALAAITNQGAYVNVHTVDNAAGELRGQIGFIPGAPGPPPAANDPVDDTFAWLGNTPLSIAPATGLLSNDPAGAVIRAADTTTSGGGQVSVNADGSFSYTPAQAFRGTDTFGYFIDGSANAATVTIQINAVAWYVNNAGAGGNGGFDAPFATLAQAESIAAVGDTVFVFTGSGTAGRDDGFDFRDNQSLIGQGVAFTFQAVPGVDTVIVPAGAAPAISRNDPANAGTLVLANNNTAAGLQITSLQNEGLQAIGVAGYTIRDNQFLNTFREGIRLLNVTGTGRVINNTFANTSREGIQLTNLEDIDGAAVPATDIAATIILSGNRITAAGAGPDGNDSHGIGIDLGGVATSVQVTAVLNTIADATQDGFNANIVDAADLTVVLADNIISGSTGEGIDLQGNNTSSMSAGADGNDLSANGGVADFRADTLDTASICLELTNNVNAAADSTFQVQNNGAGFELFQLGNDTAVVDAGAGAITIVAQGACGLP